MRVRRRAKLRREGYTPAHAYQLLKGYTFLYEGYGRPERGDFDDATARADWETHRAELMAYWCQDPAGWTSDPSEPQWIQAEPGGPGSRPWAWWTFEAPEPRRIVGHRGLEDSRVIESPVTVDTSAWSSLWRTERWRHFSFGMPRLSPGLVHFECEWVYLDRLGLLTPAEHLALPEGVFESECEIMPAAGRDEEDSE